MHTSFRRALWLLCLLAARAHVALGADALPPAPSVAGPDWEDVFDFSRAARPRPGDWLEYRLAFPADPLESRLSPEERNAAGSRSAPGRPPETPSASGAGAGTGGMDYEALARLEPVFDPQAAWVTVPVRLQIREVFDDACNAEVTFAGAARPVRLSAAPGQAAEFRYHDGGETERTLRVGGTEYSVTEVRREGSEYAFVRWFSTEIPFGTVRFATDHVDMQLVAFGRGLPPEFPVDPENPIDPPLGGLR